MELKYLVDVDKISVVADEISNYISNIGDYTGVTIDTTGTCPTKIFNKNYDNTDILNVDSDFYVDSNILYIKPTLFGLTSFVDGVYKFTISFTTTTGYIRIANCTFVDITLKCKVATFIKNILNESKNVVNEKVGTLVHLLHYSLVNGSNCGCNCVEMCEVYTELVNLLSGIDPQVLEDCGC